MLKSSSVKKQTSNADLSILEKKVLKELRDKKYSEGEVKAILEQIRFPKMETGNKHRHFTQDQTSVKFAVVGDTHVGSKYFDKEALHKFYEQAYNRGVRTFYQVGDLIDGENMWRGQVYQIYAHGLDAQVRAVQKEYPKLKGATTHFITGNHDDSFRQTAGVNPGRLIEQARDDMKYLGSREATVLLGEKGKTRMMLQHPGGGSSYALSYKPQKIVESFEGGTKPHLLFIGHYHKIGQFFYRNVHTFLAGTFESQTSFMKEKGLAAHKGSWIIGANLAEDGTVTSLETELVSFYH